MSNEQKRDLLSNTEPSDSEDETSQNNGVSSSGPGPEQPKSLPAFLTRAPANDMTLEVDRPASDRFQSFKTRTIYTILLLCMFFTTIKLGHLYCGILVVLLSSAIFREIISLKRNVEKDNKLPYFYALRWFWFWLTMFYLLRHALAPQLEMLSASYSPILTPLLQYHSFISYSFACAGLIAFVLSLRRFTLKYQFTQLAWTMMTLTIVVAQTIGHIANIYQGMIWFLLPTSLVIINDITAYLFGFFFGKRRLIKLSPKKTWEGWLGGSICTVLWGIGFASWTIGRPWWTCPASRVEAASACEVRLRDLAMTHTWQLHSALPTITITSLEGHALVLSIFASIVAPFGGFFASGFKRAFKIKDFGDSIPGHGGVTDRFDCQVIMGMFTYIYVLTYVAGGSGRVEAAASVVLALNEAERFELWRRLSNAGVEVMRGNAARVAWGHGGEL